MRVPIGGNKWSHARTRAIRAAQSTRRRNPDKCSCGRFKGSPLCQCRIDQVRREMVADEQLEMCLQMGAVTETREREDSE